MRSDQVIKESTPQRPKQQMCLSEFDVCAMMVVFFMP